jgi:predicted DNA-binding ribbon-helix-helix protein
MIPNHIRRYSFLLHGRRTSVSLEPEFRSALAAIAADMDVSTNILVSRINSARDHANLSSAIRLFVLRHALTAANVGTPRGTRGVEGVRPRNTG